MVVAKDSRDDAQRIEHRLADLDARSRRHPRLLLAILGLACLLSATSRLASDPDEIRELVRAKRVEVVDESGSLRAVLEHDRLVLHDEASRPSVIAGIQSGSSFSGWCGIATMRRGSSNHLIDLGANPGTPFLTLYDGQGEATVQSLPDGLTFAPPRKTTRPWAYLPRPQLTVQRDLIRGTSGPKNDTFRIETRPEGGRLSVFGSEAGARGVVEIMGRASGEIVVRAPDASDESSPIVRLGISATGDGTCELRSSKGDVLVELRSHAGGGLAVARGKGREAHLSIGQDGKGYASLFDSEGRWKDALAIVYPPAPSRSSAGGSPRANRGAVDQPCTSCSGSGRTTCSSCWGIGYHTQSGSRVNWNGEIEYYTENIPCLCSGGQVTCGLCGGTGRRG